MTWLLTLEPSPGPGSRSCLPACRALPAGRKRAAGKARRRRAGALRLVRRRARAQDGRSGKGPERAFALWYCALPLDQLRTVRPPPVFTPGLATDHETIEDEKAKGSTVPAFSRVQVGASPFMWGCQVKRNMIVEHIIVRQSSVGFGVH